MGMTMARTAMMRASLAVLVIGAPLLPVAAYAQAGNQECAGLGSAAAEIACLREALGAAREALAGPEDQPAPAVAPPPNRTEPSTATAAQREIPTLGGEQLPRAAAAAAEQVDPARVVAMITASRADRRGLLVMQLDNGQIWRQNEGVDLPIRLDEDERVRVEIARSGFGGYRMNFPDLGRRIAVSRLR
jgi:hypothetical protein